MALGTIATRPACSLIAAEEPHKVDAVVGDEREFIFDDPRSQYPIRLAAQAEVIHVSCLKARVMSDSGQRLM